MNNILSTDSISPAALYPKRKTGNRRFFPVVACPSNEVIFLYSKIPSYKVSDVGVENYRVVIALDSDRISLPIKKLDNKHNDIDVYVCKSTIFFTPQNAYFLYEGSDAYQTCRILAEQSLENKTFNLYKYRIIARDSEFEWNNTYCGEYNPESLSSDIFDDKIDRIKGAIVCYYAGLNQVITPALATLRMDARKIRNVFSAIVNSPNKKLSQEQNSILKPIIKEFYEVFLSVDPISLENKKAIDSSLSSSKAYCEKEEVIKSDDIDILKIIDELGLMPALMQKLGRPEPFDINSLYDIIIGNSKKADLLSIKMNEMDKAITTVERSLSSSSKCQIKLDNVFQISDEHKLIVSDGDAEIKFYNTFLNALIDGKHLEDPDQKPSLAIVLLGGQILMSLYGKEKWDSSSSRNYVNALLTNIQNGTPFDVLSNQNDILQAFAIFSLKGSDIEKLSDNLLQNGILEYRFAWGLYGATYGYSQLPKTFTANVLNEELLDEIFKLLFPECSKVCTAVAPNSDVARNGDNESSAVHEGPLNEKLDSIKKGIDSFSDDLRKTPLQTQKNDIGLDSFATEKKEYGQINKEKTSSRLRLDEMDDLPPDDFHLDADSMQNLSANLDSKGLISQSIQKENASTPHKYSALWGFCINALQKTRSTKKEDFVTFFSDAIDKIFETSNSLVVIKNKLKNISPPQDIKRIWTNILNKFIMPQIEEEETQERRGMNIKQDSLFKLIIYDRDAVDRVKEILNDSSIEAKDSDKKKVLENFVYLRDNYYKSDGKYFENSKKNSTVLSHFFNLCFAPKNKKCRIDDTEKNKYMVKKVVDSLKNEYPDC